MKGDFAKAYNAGRQAVQEQQFKGQLFSIWDGVFTVFIAMGSVVSLEEHWFPTYLTVLILVLVVLGYGVIKGVLQQRKMHKQTKDKQS